MRQEKTTNTVLNVFVVSSGRIVFSAVFISSIMHQLTHLSSLALMPFVTACMYCKMEHASSAGGTVDGMRLTVMKCRYWRTTKRVTRCQWCHARKCEH